MNKKLIALLLFAAPLIMNAQAAFDALNMSQTELRGTSRFMAMGGAYTAVGGDISSMNQNPGGIGIYRNSDLAATISLDFNSSKADGMNKLSNTRFNFNNVGYVGALKLDGDILKNFNWGFSYNRNQDFHRHYTGGWNGINSSITNYVAGLTTAGGWTESDLHATGSSDPYWNSNAPWISVLGFDSYWINPNQSAPGSFQGLMGAGTTGYAEYEIDEKGHADEYGVTLAGNCANIVYWGFGFGFFDLDYDGYMYYGESLNNAYVPNNENAEHIVNGRANYGLVNYLDTKGTGYNFKLGVIVKPVNEFRLGFAFHTPTYYDMRDLYSTISDYEYLPDNEAAFSDGAHCGDTWNEYHYRISTPWRFMGGIAGVIGKSAIVSADYEYTGYNTMRVKYDNGDEDISTTNDINDYFRAAHKISVGAEFKVSPNFALRAGYSYQTSPVNKEYEDGVANVNTVSTNPSYEFNRTTQYITAGFGYKYKSFYLDMAYVHQNRKSTFNSFPTVTYSDGTDFNNMADIDTNKDRVSLTLGFRF
ncbi:MAG: outer membrane protein transport protein [Muribaculaceae bacterium]|nr:outer membrane protein transport protein [Muribaculaceae bacterium]